MQAQIYNGQQAISEFISASILFKASLSAKFFLWKLVLIDILSRTN